MEISHYFGDLQFKGFNTSEIGRVIKCVTLPFWPGIRLAAVLMESSKCCGNLSEIVCVDGFRFGRTVTFAF